MGVFGRKAGKDAGFKLVGFLMYRETAFAAYRVFDDMVGIAYAVEPVVGCAFFTAAADDGKVFAVAGFGFIVEIVGVEDMTGSAADVFFAYERIFWFCRP